MRRISPEQRLRNVTGPRVLCFTAVLPSSPFKLIRAVARRRLRGGTLMQRRLREVGLAAAIFGLLAGMSTVMAVPSTGLMISEVYGGGGNAGATLTRDFIELGNAGTVAAPVDGWSV